jgi:HAD superfamily hydrolase (TIGR01549 family)
METNQALRTGLISRHPPMNISVILFDLGSTLLYSRDPWQPIFQAAEIELMRILTIAGMPVDHRPLKSGKEGFLTAYYADRGDGAIEKTALTFLKEILLINGYPHFSDQVLRDALDAMYHVTQQNWYLETDAVHVLNYLTSKTYRLGMVSNTSDDQNAQQLIDKFHLRSYFEKIITSAACGIRKPDPRIFQLALDHFQAPPAQVMMVGDTLDADILGANQAGLYSVWITRRAEHRENGLLPIQPHAVIACLSDLPGLLSELESQ